METYDSTDYFIIRTRRFTEEEYQEIKDLIIIVLRRKSEKRIIEELVATDILDKFERW